MRGSISRLLQGATYSHSRFPEFNPAANDSTGCLEAFESTHPFGFASSKDMDLELSRSAAPPFNLASSSSISIVDRSLYQTIPGRARRING